jgi:hypothetical protein
MAEVNTSSVSGAGSAPVMLNPSEFPKPLGYNPFPNTLGPYIAAVIVCPFHLYTSFKNVHPPSSNHFYMVSTYHFRHKRPDLIAT